MKKNYYAKTESDAENILFENEDRTPKEVIEDMFEAWADQEFIPEKYEVKDITDERDNFNTYLLSYKWDDEILEEVWTIEEYKTFADLMDEFDTAITLLEAGYDPETEWPKWEKIFIERFEEAEYKKNGLDYKIDQGDFDDIDTDEYEEYYDQFEDLCRRLEVKREKYEFLKWQEEERLLENFENPLKL